MFSLCIEIYLVYCDHFAIHQLKDRRAQLTPVYTHTHAGSCKKDALSIERHCRSTLTCQALGTQPSQILPSLVLLVAWPHRV